MVPRGRGRVDDVPLLVLLRHAKAEERRADDHSRVLAPRGVADCARVREWLLAKQLRPDRVLVSTSARTRQTWDLAGVGDAQPGYDAQVYDASLEDLLAVVRQTPADVATLVLVGHDPGLTLLAWTLDDSPQAREWTDRGMRTAAVAVLEVDAWPELDRARLVDHT